MGQTDQATEEQGAGSSEQTKEPSQQKLLTAIANFLVQWKYFSKSGEIKIVAGIQDGEVVVAELTSHEQLPLEERST